MEILPYDQGTHASAVRRIWREVGWLESGPEFEPGVDALLAAGSAFLAISNGEPECCVSTAPGIVRHQQSDLPFVCVTSVTTGRVARRQGLASRLTAHAIAQAAIDGAAVAGLSIFDQGFYDRLGFGAGSCEHIVSFDPAQLRISHPWSPPVRITFADAAEAHAARLSRMRQHGSCVLTPEGITRSDMVFHHNGFGLGYRSLDGKAITHYLWIGTKSVDHGPYHVSHAIYQTWDQFLELLAVLRTLSDQAHLIRLREPAGFQLQDVLDQPFRQYRITEDGKFAARNEAYAYWQMRICSIEACLAATSLSCAPLQLNVEVTDPISDYLPGDSPWRGTAGQYSVTLGPVSSALRGKEPGLPTLRCSVGAFTRLWLGVLPASSLAVTDALAGPADLLAALDRVLRLPRPSPDWEF